MKNIYFIILSLVVITYIVIAIRKNKISVRTSFFWIMLMIVMLILSIFPYSIDSLATSLGIVYPPALLLTIAVVLLLVIDFNYSKKIAELERKTTDLAQELAIVKEKIKDKK